MEPVACGWHGVSDPLGNGVSDPLGNARGVYCVKIIKKHVLQYLYAGSEEKTGPLSLNLNQRLIIDNKCVHHLAL